MDINNPIFQNEDSARHYLEAVRWPNGPSCPHCGEAENVVKMEGKKHRPGLLNCRSCRKQFSVTVGTVFERSKIPLHKWLLATYLLTASKKGMSTHQLHRMLGITYKSAWFMTHRIREAMRGDAGMFGAGGGTVEVDETFIGFDPTKKKGKGGFAHKQKVLALVDRTTGRSKSMVVDNLKAKNLIPILRANIAKEAHVMTDEAAYYYGLPLSFRSHGTVNHSKEEYVSLTNPNVHTNTIEGYFSIFKRGMKGVYQHCGNKHLHRYLSEFDFRYSNRSALGVDDKERAENALRGIEGKRLTYRRTHSGA